MRLGAMNLAVSSGLTASAPAAPVVVSQTADFGALSPANSEGFKAVSAIDTLVDFVSVDSVVSGDGTGWGVDGDGCLVRTTGTPASSDGAVLRCTVDGALSVDITIATETNAYGARDAVEFLTAMEAADGTATETKVYLRRGVTLTPWDNDWFQNFTHTANIQIEGRDGRPANWVIIHGSNSVEDNARFANAGYFTFKYVHFYCQFDRTLHTGNSRGIESIGTYRGPVKFSFCEFSGSSWDTIGPGPHFRGLIGGTVDSEYLFEISDCIFHDSRRAASLSFGNGTACDLVLERNLYYDISVDYHSIGGAPASSTLTDLDMHSPKVDKYRVYFKSSPNTYYTHVGALTGAADGTKCLFRMQNEFDDGISAEQILFEVGGLTVRRLATGEIRAIANDTGGSPAVTLTTTGTAGSFRRIQVLLSLDTEGTSNLSVGSEGAAGALTWENVSTTASSETLDLTGTCTVHGAGTSENYLTELNYWQGIAPDVSDSTVRGHFTTSNGMGADRSALFVIYPSPLVDLHGGLDFYNDGDNNGSGGPFVLTGQVDVDHADFVQFVPLHQIRDITMDNIVMYSGRFDDQKGVERWEETGVQGVFAEDTSRTTISMTIASPCVVTDADHGLIEGDPVSFSSTGTLPTGVVDEKVYYVIASGLTTGAFQFSETVGGSAVNSSGSSSGTIRRHSQYVNCTGSNILIASTSAYGGIWSNAVKCRYNSCTGVIDPTWTDDYNSDTPNFGINQHFGGWATGNEVYDISARGIYDAGDTPTQENNITVKADEVGANAWSNLYVGDGEGGFNVASFDEFKQVFAPKASGPLDAANTIGALTTAGEFTTPRLLDSNEAETTALLARMGSTPSGARETAVNDLIVALKGIGLSKFGGFYDMTLGSTDGLLNWIEDEHNLTQTGTVNYTSSGATADSTSDYLDTGFNPSTDLTESFLLDSSHIGIYVETDSQNSNPNVGNSNARITVRSTSDISAYRMNDGSTKSVANTDAIGHYVSVRTGASVCPLYKDGSSLFAGTTGSTGATNATLQVLRRNGSSSNTQTHSFMHWGGGLTAGEVSTLNTAVEAYRTAIGL